MNNKLKAAVVALGAAAVIVPGASAAKPDGKPAKAQSKAHGKNAKNAVFRGTVVSSDLTAGSVVVKVASASRWGRHLDEQDVTFTLASVKKLKVADTNGDGKVDLADVKPGDRAHVQARMAKDAAGPLAARAFQAKAPAADAPEGGVQP